VPAVCQICACVSVIGSCCVAVYMLAFCLIGASFECDWCELCDSTVIATACVCCAVLAEACCAVIATASVYCAVIDIVCCAVFAIV
jgi:hypothetical protein